MCHNEVASASDEYQSSGKSVVRCINTGERISPNCPLQQPLKSELQCAFVLKFVVLCIKRIEGSIAMVTSVATAMWAIWQLGLTVGECCD